MHAWTRSVVVSLTLCALTARTGTADPDGVGSNAPVVLPSLVVSSAAQPGTTTSKTSLPAMDLPLSLQTIPAGVFQEQGITRLNEGILNIPGVGINSGLGFFDLYQLRGFEAEIYRDGMREQRDLRHSLFDVESVDVLRGPASVLYGRGEPGGVINVRSKRPTTVPLATLNYGTRSYLQGRNSDDADLGSALDQQNVGVDLGGPLADRVFYRLNAAQEASDGWRDYVRYEYRDVAGAITMLPSDDHILTASVAHYDHVDVEDDGLVALNGEFPDVDRSTFYGASWNRDDTEVNRTSLDWDYLLSDALHLKNSVRYDDFWAHDVSQRPFNAIDVNTVEMEQRDFDITTESLAGQSEVYYESDCHHAVAGLEVSATDAQRDDWDSYSGIPPQNLLNPEAHRALVPWSTLPNAHTADSDYDLLTMAFFAQDVVSVTDFAKLMLGGRADRFEQTYTDATPSPAIDEERNDTEVSPRAGLVLQPADWTSFYGSYSVGFRPSGQDAPFGGVELDPEKATQYEVGNKSTFAEGRLSTTVALFDLVREDVQVGLPDGGSEQIGEWDAQGVEFTVAGKPVERWSILAGYAYTDAKVKEGGTWYTGDTPPNVPEQTANLWTTYAVTDHWEAGGGVRYVGDREAMYDNSLDLFDPYTTAHLTLAYRAKTWVARLNADNIFDEDYFVGGRGWYAQALPGDPASVSLSLTKSL